MNGGIKDSQKTKLSLFLRLFQQIVSPCLPVPLYIDQTEPPVVWDDQVGMHSHGQATLRVEPETTREAREAYLGRVTILLGCLAKFITFV